MEKAVTSVAVPDVEEIAQNFALFLRVGIPNTLHISSKVQSGYSYLIHIAFAASMGEPPPIATIQSGPKSCISFAPFMTVSTEGSDSMPSNSFTSIPASCRYCTTLSRKPKRFMEPPPTQTKAFFPLKVFSASSAFSPW